MKNTKNTKLKSAAMEETKKPQNIVFLVQKAILTPEEYVPDSR